MPKRFDLTIAHVTIIHSDRGQDSKLQYNGQRNDENPAATKITARSPFPFLTATVITTA